ncbi:MAG: carbohydrate binding family 9 domain-containing protein [Gemmatimonadetes bacterium]|nr:carbohydrate binding family 9 domain-containing protein [Gemmatimonadota bacterium]
MMKRLAILVALPCALVVWFASTPGAYAQERPGLEARLVERAPSVDGSLDDPTWQGVPITSEFRQREPVAGLAATEETRVRIAYDEARLYVGVELLDSDPAQIRATELRRDNTLESDDTFTILIDSYHDHRNAFIFRVNPRGTRFDGQFQNEANFVYRDWDEQWTAAAQITSTGWVVEYSIPFKILRFSGAAEQTWGLNFERVIKRKNELVYWSGWEQNFGFHHVSQSGHLTGLRDIQQVERLRVRPYVLAGGESFQAVAEPDRRRVSEIGLEDLKYAITSNLTSDLAVNPDFAQTEVDAQQINLTRFSLFFPEKRQFFIEGRDYLSMGIGLLHFGPPPLELMYSRKIGLGDAGEPVPVTYGGKLSGRTAGFDVGFIDVQTDDSRLLPSENFAAFRLKRQVMERSYVGALVTNREGSGQYNRVVAADARFVFWRYLNVMGLLAKSADSETGGQEWVKHLGAEWRADLLEAGIIYLDIDPQFAPGIGFVRRNDRMIGTRVSLKPRPRGSSLFRQFDITPHAVFYHEGTTHALENRELRLALGANFQSGDRIAIRADNNVERLTRPFPIATGVLVPPDRYEWNTVGATFTPFNGRPVSGRIDAVTGGFYNGTKTTWDLQGDLKPTQNLSFNPTYQINNVDLEQGSFTTHLVGLRSNVSFTRNLLTAAYVQYNSSGELAALQLRFNYIFRTIDNIYIVYNETHFTDGIFHGKSNRSLVLKVTYSVHR